MKRVLPGIIIEVCHLVKTQVLVTVLFINTRSLGFHDLSKKDSNGP